MSCSVHTWNDNLRDSLLHLNAVVTCTCTWPECLKPKAHLSYAGEVTAMSFSIWNSLERDTHSQPHIRERQLKSIVMWNISELDTQDYTWSTQSFTSNYIYSFSRRFYPNRLTIQEYNNRYIIKRQTDTWSACNTTFQALFRAKTSWTGRGRERGKRNRKGKGVFLFIRSQVKTEEMSFQLSESSAKYYRK